MKFLKISATVLMTVAVCLMSIACSKDSNTDVSQADRQENTNTTANQDSQNTGSAADGGADIGVVGGANSGADSAASGGADSSPAGEDVSLPAESGEAGPEEDPVRNTVIVLDPGHGGRNSGSAANGVAEREMTLQTANYVRDYLLDNYQSVEVYLTREDKEALSDDAAEDLALRAEFALSVGADILVSLHYNQTEYHNAYGATVYVTNRPELHDESAAMARSILDKLVGLGLKDDGVLTRNSNDMFDEAGKPLDYYGIIRQNAARGIPALIVEHCFTDHPNDDEFWQTEEAVKRLAKADAEGLAEYFGLVKK